MSIDDLFFYRNELNNEELKEHGFEYKFDYDDLRIYKRDNYLYAFEPGEYKLKLYMKLYNNTEK